MNWNCLPLYRKKGNGSIIVGSSYKDAAFAFPHQLKRIGESGFQSGSDSQEESAQWFGRYLYRNFSTAIRCLFQAGWFLWSGHAAQWTWFRFSEGDVQSCRRAMHHAMIAAKTMEGINGKLHPMHCHWICWWTCWRKYNRLNNSPFDFTGLSWKGRFGVQAKAQFLEKRQQIIVKNIFSRSQETTTQWKKSILSFPSFS